MQKKIVLYVSNTDWYFKLHWMNRALAARDAGYRVKLVTDFGSEEIRSALEQENIECFHVAISRSGINPVRELISFLRLYYIIKNVNPDIIHSVTVKPNLYAGMVGRCLSIPVLKSITGTGAVFSNNSFFFRCIRTMVIKMYRFVGQAQLGAFIFENREDKNKFEQLGISSRQLSVLMYGSGVDSAKYMFHANLFTRNKVRFLFAARLLKDKGLDTLLAALDKLYAKRQDFELYIAGIYDLLSRNAYTESDMTLLINREYVHWLGKRDDIDVLLLTVDVVVLPTRYGEGIPRILLESGFTGRVVVATDVPGCREIIENRKTGYLMEPGHDEQLMAILDEIMKNPSQAENYARELYQKVKGRYSDEVVVNDFLSLYRDVFLSQCYR